LDNAAGDVHPAFIFAVYYTHVAVAQNGGTGLMPGEETHIAGDAAHNDHIARLIQRDTFRRYNAQLQLHGLSLLSSGLLVGKSADTAALLYSA
jgi:hypothetical protein